MARPRFRYEVTVRQLPPPGGSAAGDAGLTFEHGNHDDILAIVDRVQHVSGWDRDSAASVAVGLKLLSEVMLQRREDPLFAPLRDPMRAFIGRLKGLSAGPR
jgi:hypothetical protein